MYMYFHVYKCQSWVVLLCLSVVFPCLHFYLLLPYPATLPYYPITLYSAALLSGHPICTYVPLPSYFATLIPYICKPCSLLHKHIHCYPATIPSPTTLLPNLLPSYYANLLPCHPIQWNSNMWTEKEVSRLIIVTWLTSMAFGTTRMSHLLRCPHFTETFNRGIPLSLP